MNEIVKKSLDESAVIIKKMIKSNDYSGLTENEKYEVIDSICRELTLNQMLQPFNFIPFRDGKLSLYANKSCTDQLRKINKISIEIVSRKSVDGVYIVTARAYMDGRTDESDGCVVVANLKGAELANAFMKAETKAKRRATLSICGLGILDESERDTIQDYIKKEDKNIPSKNTSSLNDIFSPKKEVKKDVIEEAIVVPPIPKKDENKNEETIQRKLADKIANLCVDRKKRKLDKKLTDQLNEIFSESFNFSFKTKEDLYKLDAATAEQAYDCIKNIVPEQLKDLATMGI